LALLIKESSFGGEISPPTRFSRQTFPEPHSNHASICLSNFATHSRIVTLAGERGQLLLSLIDMIMKKVLRLHWNL